MPDLLREQFPHLRPIVEAFGYRNLEFEGWEADDVIATLATRADEEGIKTCVVSTDRDAFQLVSENVCLMMTPRGVSDVNVYTPERVEARYGIRPDQIPDFIGLKGDTSDNIPGVPGIGDKTAGQLVAQYGSLEEVLEHVDELSPARRKNLTEFADQARAAKVLATMRRDLELDCDPAELVLAPPDRAAAARDVPAVRVPRAARAGRRARRGGAGARADLGRHGGAPGARESCRARRDRRDRGRRGTRSRSRSATRSSSRRARSASRATFVAHDAKALRRRGRRRHDDPRLPDRPGAQRVPPRRPRGGVRGRGGRRAGGRGGDGAARPARRRHAAPARAAARPRARARRRAALPRRRDAAHRRPRRMEEAGVRIDTYRMGEITARLADRVEELESRAYELAGEEFVLGSPQQLGAHPVREARAHARPQGQDRLLDRHEGAALDPRRARDRGRDRGVARALEAPQHVPPAAAAT